MSLTDTEVPVRALIRIDHNGKSRVPDTDTAVFHMPWGLAEKMRDLGHVELITAEVDTDALLAPAATPAGVVGLQGADTAQGVTFADAVAQLDTEMQLRDQVAALNAQLEEASLVNHSLVTDLAQAQADLAQAHADLHELRNADAGDTLASGTDTLTGNDSLAGGDTLAGGDAAGNDTVPGTGDAAGTGNDSVPAGGDAAGNDTVPAGTKTTTASAKTTKAKA